MMRRLAFALLVPSLIAAGPPAAVTSGNVTTLRLEPRDGATELTVEIAGGEVSWKDFRLSGPNRVVVDIEGARSALSGDRFEGINRGGVAAVRTSQYTADVVRVVLVLDRDAEYRVARVAEGLRVSLRGAGGEFQPWSTGASSARSAAREPEARGTFQAAPSRPQQQPRQQQQPRGRLITVSFEGAVMRDVLASFAEFSGRSIVPSAEAAAITGVTATIRAQPWDEALRALLRAYGLAAIEEPSGIIRVDDVAALAERETQEALVTQLFRINYVPVAEVQQSLAEQISERGAITVNPTTNTLIVTDVASNVDNIGRLLQDLDVQTPQVTIHAKIIFINRTNAEALGVTYDLKDSRGNQLNRLVAVPDPNDPAGELTNDNLISLGGNSIAALGNANQRVAGASLETVISLVLGRYTLIGFLDALQSAQLSDVQAAPVVTTVSNREAEIWVGERTPIRVVDLGQAGGGGGGDVAAGPRATAQLVETGIRLRVTPQVTSDRRVLMDIHAERSSAQLAESEIGVQFRQQQGDTRVMVNDGETAVIGGLTVTEVTSSRVGIPFLMDIPVVGALFRRTTSEESKRDLLIMVTPHIVDRT